MGHQARSAEIAREILNRLRYDKNTTSAIVQLISEHDNRFDSNPKKIKRILNKLGPENGKRLIAVQKADNLAQNPEQVRNGLQSIIESEKIMDRIIAENQVFSLAQLEISGKDLIAMGVKPGPDIGRILQQILDDVIDCKIENVKDALCSEVLKYL